MATAWSWKPSTPCGSGNRGETMKIIFYCQHVLGIGHFFRSLEICEALHDHEVILLTGGPRPDVPLGSHIREVSMPGLMMNPDFSELFSTEKDKSTEQVKEERKIILFDLVEAESPDIFMAELYPFGRKAFRFELDPVLEHLKNKPGRPCRAVCSLRDILVEKKDPEKYEGRVVDILNQFFDALFVHSDPTLFPLDETFSRIDKIAIPIVYTGFVTSRPPSNARSEFRNKLGIRPGEKLVTVSAGGGKVGAPLLESSMRGLKIVAGTTPLRTEVFAGPFMDEDDYSQLKSLEDENISASRFTPDFLSYLTASDLSVSMAGYNTCMNLLACGTPALVWPFSQNREQRMRAERLAQKAPFTVLEDDDLSPSRLASIISDRLSSHASPAAKVDLLGSFNTARSLESMFGPHNHSGRGIS